jgi:3-deoxy-D-manno-octulosonate 8-phosphate phosphatase (KDO 8-P phosphatase)
MEQTLMTFLTLLFLANLCQNIFQDVKGSSVNVSTAASIDIKWFKETLKNTALINKLKAIKLIISDVDGTLTDTEVYYDAEGEGGRRFNIQDGYIVKPTLQAGLFISLMSGKDNPSTLQRASKLGIPQELCIVGLNSKTDAVKKIQSTLSVLPKQTLIFGDDYLDAEIKLNNTVGFYACPANSVFYLQPHADLIIPRNGGDGAFRLLMDLILYVQNKHFAQALIAHTIA